MHDRIKRLVAYYKRIYGTNDPFELADYLGILYQIGNIQHEGSYMFLKNHKYIFLSNKLEDPELRIVMSHEIGHAILDPKENCYFIRNYTLQLTSKVEQRANIFAAELLITDDLIRDFSEFTVEQFANCTGYPKELINLRLKG